MNSLSPPIFPDNTEVNGKMKMKCLNINGNNINEIVTGPKIIYGSGERSFLKSISIDGYRITVSYIDDLFQGSTDSVHGAERPVEVVLRKDGLNVIYVILYPNGNVDIRGTSYNSVNTSWKTISFNISTDIQEGYIRLQDGSKSVSFDFILPSLSEHTLYSSFISDMKYMPKNVEVTKLIDGGGKKDADLLDIANNNKPCLIISNSPQYTDLTVLSHVSGDTNQNYFVTNKMNDNICTGCEYNRSAYQSFTLFCFINDKLSVGSIANETHNTSTLGGCIKFKNKWILAWNEPPFLWATEPNVESPINAPFTAMTTSPYKNQNIPYKLTYLDEEVAVCSGGISKNFVNIQNYSVCTDGTTWSTIKTPGIVPFKLGNNYYAIGFIDGKLYKTTDKYNTLTEIGDTYEARLWLISYANNKAFIYSSSRLDDIQKNEYVVVVNEDGTFRKTVISGRSAGGFMFLNDKYLFLDSSSSDVFESTDGINDWTLNPNIKIPQTLGVEQLDSVFEPRWFIMTRDGANEYEYMIYPSSVTMVLNNSTTPEPVVYKATSIKPNITTRDIGHFVPGTKGPVPELRKAQNSVFLLEQRTRSLPMPLTESYTEEEKALGANSLKVLSAEFRRTNDRLDELENKLRKFGIE